MSQLATSEFSDDSRALVRPRVASLLGTIIFSGLVALLVITAIPYGTVEVWWKAFFVCAVLTLTILWLIDGYLSGSWIDDGLSIMLPMAALVLFAFLQTVPLGQTSAPAGLTVAITRTISVAPSQTRFFALQLLSLTLAGLLLFRYTSTEKRMRILMAAIIAIGIASAIFGILRQTTQRSLGFGLPLLQMIGGYGQFINRNHFAYLMEMGFGLTLGLVIARGVKRDKLLLYVAALLPLWMALVLSGSRGGLFAMMAQVVATALLFDMVVRSRDFTEPAPRIVSIARSLPVRLALLGVLICVVTVGTLWMGGDPLAARIEEARTQLTDDTSDRRGVSRNEIWRASGAMFLANPILGVGMGAYWAAIPQFHNASGAMTPQQAHNDYLEVLGSGGVVAFAILAWFAVAVFRRSRENLRSSNHFRRAAAFGATIGIVGVAVHSLVDFGLHMMVNAFMFTTLVVIATSKPRWANRSVDET